MIHIIKFLFSMTEGIVTMVIEGGFDALNSIIKPEKDHAYTAEFGRPEDQLTTRGDGFKIGYKWGNSLIESNSHLFISGGSGSGKSSVVAFCTLLQSNECSYVVFDPNREQVLKTSGYMHSVGYKVLQLDYDRYSQSIGFSAFHNCKNEMDVFRTAQVPITNSSAGNSKDYWSLSAANIIGFFAYALWKHAPNYCNFPNILRALEIFSFDPQRIDRWVAFLGDMDLANRYKSIAATPDKTLQSSVATALSALEIYHSPNVASITSRNTVSFEQFRKGKTILYICGSPATSAYCRSVSAGFFDAFFAHILEDMPSAGSLPIRFILDECASMRIDALPLMLEQSRKFNISLATFWQDYNQCEHIYGHNQAANIFANHRVKVFMPSGQPLSTCKMLQELLGKYQYESEKGTKTRELLTAQEIFQLKDILVLNGNNKPLLLKPLPYYLNRKLKACTELPPYVDPAITTPHIPEYLDFA